MNEILSDTDEENYIIAVSSWSNIVEPFDMTHKNIGGSGYRYFINKYYYNCRGVHNAEKNGQYHSSGI